MASLDHVEATTAYSELGNLKEADYCYARILRINPNDLQALFDKASVATSMQQSRKVRQGIPGPEGRRALVLTPLFPSANGAGRRRPLTCTSASWSSARTICKSCTSWPRWARAPAHPRRFSGALTLGTRRLPRLPYPLASCWSSGARLRPRRPTTKQRKRRRPTASRSRTSMSTRSPSSTWCRACTARR